MADRSLKYVLELSDKLSSPLGKVAIAAHAASAATVELTETTRRMNGVLSAGTMQILAHAAAARELAAAYREAGVAGKGVPVGGRAPGGAPAVPPYVPPGPLPKPPSTPEPVPVPSTEGLRGLRSEAAAQRALLKELDALRRQQIGTIAGRAAEAEEEVDRVLREARAYGTLTEELETALRTRKKLIAADAEAQQESLRRRGVDPTRAYGASGTRQTTIGSGVLSGFFDTLFSRMGGQGDPAKRLDELRESAGKADTALKTLAGALGVVSPAGERAATAAGDLVGSLEVLLTPAGATVGALAGVAVSLGALAAGSVAAVLHVATLREELEGLERLGAPVLIPPATVQAAEDAADAVGAIRPALSAIAGVVAGEVAPALDDLATSAVAAALLAAEALKSAGDAAVTVSDTIGTTIADLITTPARRALQALEGLYSLAAGVESALGLPGDSADFLAGIRDARGALEQWTDKAGADLGSLGRDLSSGVVEGLRVGLRGATAGAREEAQALIGALSAKRAEKAGGSDAAATAKAAEKAATDAADALERLRDIAANAADATLDPIDRLTAKYVALREEIQRAADAAGGTSEAAAAALQAAAAVNAAESAEVREAYAQLGEQVGQGLTEAFAALQGESLQGKVGRGLTMAGGAVGALGRGDLVSAVGAASGVPQVALAGEALGLLAQLGQLGEEELRTRGEAFARAVGEGLRVLPGLIVSILPDLVAALIEGLLVGLASLPEAIAQAIREVLTIGEAGTPERRQAVGGALGGAAAGAATGAVVGGGPVGALIGGAVGAFVGLAAGRKGGERQGSASRSALDLAGGLSLPGGGRSAAAPVPVVVSVRGSGVGLQQAIDVDNGPYGRVAGRRS
jgi:hypothetical protein